MVIAKGYFRDVDLQHLRKAALREIIDLTGLSLPILRPLINSGKHLALPGTLPNPLNLRPYSPEYAAHLRQIGKGPIQHDLPYPN